MRPKMSKAGISKPGKGPRRLCAAASGWNHQGNAESASAGSYVSHALDIHGPKGPLVLQAALDKSQPADACFINRETSWLEFNKRVLHEAQDLRTPLLERVSFLGIVTSNLDEFFMKRVGLLLRQVATGVLPRKLDGLAPAQQLQMIRPMVQEMIANAAKVWEQSIRPALAAERIFLHTYDELTPQQKQWAEGFFRGKVFAVLTPLAVDPGHPFPFISNLSTSLGVALRQQGQDELLFARIKIPAVLPPLVRLEGFGEGEHHFLTMLDLIRHNLDELFPGMTVVNAMPFRITRNAEVEQDDEEPEDLLEQVEQELRLRRFEPVVRLETCANPEPWMLQLLMEELDLNEFQVYQMDSLLDYTWLRPIAALPVPALRKTLGARGAGPADGSPGRYLQPDSLSGYPGAPPLRELLRQHRAVRARGRGRSGRAGHQDHAIPHGH